MTIINAILQILMPRLGSIGMPTTSSFILSPCIKSCSLDANDVCSGCHRTLEEIKCWSQAEDITKIEIIKRCHHRQLADT